MSWIGWHLAETIQCKFGWGLFVPFLLFKGEYMTTFVKEYHVRTIGKLTKEQRKAAEDKRLKERDEDSKMVTGIFENEEVPGGDVTFTYRKYKEDPYKTYTFVDGHEYTIPLGVAKHINNQTQEKRHKYLVDKNGRKVVGLGPSRRRYKFSSKEFM